MASTRDHTFDPTFDPEDLSWPRRILHQIAYLVEDLPFVPSGPYEPRRRQLLWRAGLIVLLAAAAYFASIGNEWLWQDERILNDLALRTPAGLIAIWADPFAGTAAPATRTLQWVTGRVMGGGPAGFRAASLGLHAWTAVMLWFVLRRLNIRGAWLAAAVVAVHPAAMLTVVWPSRQGDLLGVAATVTAAWAYLRALDVRPPAVEGGWTDPTFHPDEEASPLWPWVIVLLSTGVALLSGAAVALAAPFFVLIVGWRHRGRPTTPAIVLLTAWAVLALAGRWAFSGRSIAASTETAVAATWTVLHGLLPFDSPFISDRSQWGGGWVIGPASASLAVAIAAIVWRRSAWAWPMLIAVAIATAHAATASTSELAAIASADIVIYGVLVILVPLAVAGLVGTFTQATETVAIAVRWALGLGLVGGLGTLLALRASAYATADRSWQHTLALNPDGVIAREELATRYLAEGFLEEAAIQLDRVPEAQRDARWLNARGKTFNAQKAYIDAARCFESAHRLQPADGAMLISFAEAEANAGRPERAAALYDDILTRVTTDAGLFTNAGLTQVRLGRAQAGADLYFKALAVDPRFLPAHINLANVLFDLGRFEESAAHLQEAVKIDPRNFAAFMNAGILLHRLGEPAKAERMFRAAVNIDPTSPDAFDDLGIVLAAQGKLRDAAWSFTQATRIDPSHAARDHLQEVRRQLVADSATQPTR